MTRKAQDAASLRARFFEQLQPEMKAVVDGVVATGATGAIYVVGGAVRDLLLDREISDVDVDLVTMADASEIAARVGRGTRVTAHERFLTATVEVGTHRIDLATARRETYSRPGALPDVEPARVEDDLLRRDFTMNALALRLDREAELLDPTGGQGDIEAGQVRVLHDASFQDDATRIFRAFRYAARMGFTIEPRTRSLIDGSLGFIETISGERLRHELHLVFDEPTGGHALEALDEAGALVAIHTALSWSQRKTRALASVRANAAGHPHEHGLALLASRAAASHADEIVERLQLSLGEAAAVRGMPALQATVEMLRRPDVKPSGVVTVLDRIAVASVESFAALIDDVRLGSLMRRYLDEWRLERPMLSGHDVMAMGIPEGPRIKQALQLIRAARLDGWASDRDDERALVLRFAKSIRDSRAMNEPIDFKLYEN